MTTPYNRIGFSVATIGTGTITVGSALANARTPAQASIPDGTLVSYSIKDGTSGYEDGWGTIGASGTTLSRDTVYDSSNGGSVIALSGSAEVRLTLLAQDIAAILSSITANTSAIATNTSNIATNTSNIATNTANIAANTTAIAGKQAAISIASPRLMGRTTAGSGAFEELTVGSGLTLGSGSLKAADINTSKLLGRTTAGSGATEEISVGTGLTLTSGVLAAQRLSATLDLYVNGSTGSNSNTGLSSGSPFLTIQKGIDTAAGYDFNGFIIRINIADGTYVENLLYKGPLLQKGGGLRLLGNTSSPNNVIISGFHQVTGSSLNLRWDGVQFKAQGNTTVWQVNGAAHIISLGLTAPVNWGASGAAGYHMIVSGPNILTIFSNYSIVGNTKGHCYATNGAIFSCEFVTIDVTGRAWSDAFVISDIFSYCALDNNTFTGSATGKRYDSKRKSIIFTNGAGATYLPGNVAGTTSDDGDYL